MVVQDYFDKNSPFLWGCIYFLIGLVLLVSFYRRAKNDQAPVKSFKNEIADFFVLTLAHLIGGRSYYGPRPTRDGKSYFFLVLVSLFFAVLGIYNIFCFFNGTKP
jgi:hypothetical protein